MKNILIILMFFPMIFFGQTVVKCVHGDCDDGEGIKNYMDRTYQGSFKNGIPHGNGVCIWNNNGPIERYEGEWENGIRTGKGLIIYRSGDKYVGEFKDGVRNGNGTYTWANGSEYNGEFMNNYLHGKGKMIYNDSYIGVGFTTDDYAKTSKILTDRVITKIYAGSPAEQAGFMVGDVILSVNNIYFNEWTKDEDSKKIGKKHKFLVKRENKTTKKIKVRIAKVSKKGSDDIKSYDGEWSQSKFEGMGTATYYDGFNRKGVWMEDRFVQSLVIEDRIKEVVESKINEWQKKGEFEKTAVYQERVKEDNRILKVKEFQALALEDLKNEFCKSIDFSNIELSSYDPDNETFILKNGRYLPSYYNKYYSLDDLVISIPIDEAPDFKKNFSSFSFKNPECIIVDDNFILSFVELHGKDEVKLISHMDSIWNEIDSSWFLRERTETRIESSLYTYRLDDAQDYTITDINYDFSDIVIDDVASAVINKKSRISTAKLRVGSSSVNKNIPTNPQVDNRYALIIGNEDYKSQQTGLNDEQNVDYAKSDAKIFREYALNTLGVPEDNIEFILDATSVEMRRTINKICKLLELESKKGKNPELIFYYAGHGHPAENTNIPYLMPVDISANELTDYAIKLDKMYKDLSATGASKITIFLDACFTGGGRESGLLASRGVKVSPKTEKIMNGNLIVFSASSKDQSALPYHEEEHGMFTYYILKKLQESKGDISMGDFADYLTDNVSIQSIKINDKEQVPVVNVSEDVKEKWRNWRF